MKNRLYQNLIQAASVCVIFLVWTVAWAAVGNELILPSFTDCVKELWQLIRTAWLWRSLAHTLCRVAAAFAISFVAAAALALLACALPWVESFLRPIVAVFRSLPTLAVLLLVLVWTGAGNAPVVVAFLSLFPMLYAEIFAAVSGVDKGLVEMSRVYGVPLKRQILRLYLPTALPYVLRGSAAAIGFALKLVVSAEVLSGTFVSLGGMMQEAKTYLNTPLLFALVLITFLLSLVLEIAVEGILKGLERRTA